jgi:penicillin-binding protein 1A
MRFRRRVLLSIPIVLSLLVGLALGLLAALLHSLPLLEDLERYRPSTITRVYDAKDRLIAEFYQERRVLVPLSRIPKHLIQATLAVEDVNFYHHMGINVKGILRAALANFQAGRVVQGGSTITQQLAKLLFLKSEERTLERKVKEALLALRIEQRYTKEEILAFYFNQIYLGAGAYGVEAAAQTYFGKGVEDLDLLEAALLAALPKAPSRFTPFQDPEAALDRRNLVLRRMREVGFITAEEEAKAVSSPLALRPRVPVTSPAPYFVEHVRRELEERYGGGPFYRQGLEVYTTLDLDLQKEAQATLLKGLRELDRRRGLGEGGTTAAGTDRGLRVPPKVGQKVRGLVVEVRGRTVLGNFSGLPGALELSDPSQAERLEPGTPVWARVTGVDEKGGRLELTWVPETEGALVALDLKSGDIRAMVGGRDFARSHFNRATQAQRQPGSAFKPFIYTAALATGSKVTDIVVDAPVAFRDGTGKLWQPANYRRRFYGPVTYHEALENSINVATVKVLKQVGPERVVRYARQLGIKSRLEPYLSLALGTSEVNLLEITSAYGAFGNTGLRPHPFAIRLIRDAEGRTLFEHTPQFERALHPEAAYLMTHMMQGVIERGTASQAKGLGKPLAGKTGTTDDFKDAWFIGFSPDIALGVWVGLDNNEPLGPGETGARAALPIWMGTMAYWLKGRPPKDFDAPPRVTFLEVDSKTGLLADPSCQGRAIRLAFLRGNEPTRTCSEGPLSPEG